MHSDKYHLIVLSVYPHIFIYQLHVSDICLFTSVSITTCTVKALKIYTGDAIWKVATSFGLPPFLKQLLSSSRFKIYLLQSNMYLNCVLVGRLFRVQDGFFVEQLEIYINYKLPGQTLDVG